MSTMWIGLGAVAGITWLSLWQSSAGGSLDTLSEADRKVYQDRFAKEIWPLLQRGGKDGCVGCHRTGSVTALHFSGDVGKDFRMLLQDGFFLPNDAGNLHARITDKDPQRRMPPGKRPAWLAKEAEVLRIFTLDLNRKEKK